MMAGVGGILPNPCHGSWSPGLSLPAVFSSESSHYCPWNLFSWVNNQIWSNLLLTDSATVEGASVLLLFLFLWQCPQFWLCKGTVAILSPSLSPFVPSGGPPKSSWFFKALTVTSSSHSVERKAKPDQDVAFFQRGCLLPDHMIHHWAKYLFSADLNSNDSTLPLATAIRLWEPHQRRPIAHKANREKTKKLHFTIQIANAQNLKRQNGSL